MRIGVAADWRLPSMIGAAMLLLAASFSFGAGGKSIDLIAVRVPVAAESPVVGSPPGAQVVRITKHAETVDMRVLSGDFWAAADPVVSFDGEHILFTAKRRANDRWQVWTGRIDGSGMHQVTDGPGDSFSPVYVGSLFHLNDEHPTDRFVYLSTDHGWVDEVSGEAAPALYAANLDGSNPWRITFDLRAASDPAVLANGRVVFSSWHQLRDGSRVQGLMAVNNDGTDMMAYYGVHLGPRNKRMAEPGHDGRTYFVESDLPGPLDGGALVYVSQRRPLNSHTRLSGEDDGGFWHSPLSLKDGRLIASYVDAKNGDSAYRIVQVDRETGRPIATLYGDDLFHYIDAQELLPTTRVRGRSSVVNMEQETGVFFCISSHISDRVWMDEIEPESVTAVRVVEGVPSRTRTRNVAATATKRILGIAPVESDGSFHIEVPAKTPVIFQLLDGDGMAVARQESWTWVMPREWRGCVGCHEDREMVVPNILAEAVVKPAVQLTTVAHRRRTVDFQHDLAPIVANRCVDCHGRGSEIDLDTSDDAGMNRAFQTVKNAVTPGLARTSPLLHHMLGWDWQDGAERPDAIQKQIIIEWIDLGASFDSRTALPEGQGR